MSQDDIRSLLAGGDRRSIGHSNEVAALLSVQPERAAELVGCVWDADPLVRIRAADAAENASRRKPELLEAFKTALLSLVGEAVQQEVRWHLAQMVPRLRLTDSERQFVIERLQTYLTDRSSIVKTSAMQSLYELTLGDLELEPMAMEVIRDAVRSGTPAMRARGRKLLRRMTGGAPSDPD